MSTPPTRAQIVADAASIARLGGPLLINNLAAAGMSFTDTVMAGQLGARDLAGLAIGAAWYNLFLFIGMGLFMAVSPAVAHAYGAEDPRRVTRYMRQSWWLALVTACVLVAGMWQARWFLPMIGITPDILPVAIGYAEAISWGLPGMLAFFSLRYVSEGIGHTRPIMFIASAALVFNVFANWVFMYGKFGMPKLGAVGCGVASAIAMWLMFGAMCWYVKWQKLYRPYAFFDRIDRPELRTLGELLRLGVPISGSILAEGGLFVAAALLMGSMGAVTASAHQIALNYASFMFMIPLAISSATTIHVGHTIGRGEIAHARSAGFTGIGMCSIVMAISACFMVLLNDQIASLYTRDVVVRDLAATLLLAAAVFQISDGVQVGAAGALRGFKDTAIPMALCWFSYWAVGFSLAYVMGVVRGGGPVLVWAGLIAGLAVCSVLLVTRYTSITKSRVRAATDHSSFVR
ncbi:MATE family multidrug resistance protein [Povalibacter uvarum]|uniref:Multidrug-efflux transporter n=1 Tax=Povalibacter uvarum TaxID=732238 RepID=A0A841HNA4_9GAMM|nr:MATE family efflux transporter [Povalibacter uvarum]MBB6093425.1 MATE family multidrug resistance protein [Povalibacter uvarum]